VTAEKEQSEDCEGRHILDISTKHGERINPRLTGAAKGSPLALACKAISGSYVARAKRNMYYRFKDKAAPAPILND